jgi:uncharacterized lipoprotein YmbA
MLASCASPPTHFFTLARVSPVGSSLPTPPFPIQVNAVHIPAVLDRSEIVRQADSDQLLISGQDRWGAPFGEMVRNILAQDLAERLPQESVILPRAPAPASAAHLVVNIAAFSEDVHRRVRLNASWTLLRGTPAKPVLDGDVNLEDQAAGDDAASQAAAMSRLLGRLADNIVAKLAKWTPANGSAA